jgi:hypothetical protein
MLATGIRRGRRYGPMLARLTRDLPRFLERPISVEQAEQVVRQRLQQRAERFLWLAEQAIYRQRRSPYRRLLEAAGCELGDLRRLVRQDGLEEALAGLAARGVYLTLEESKGGREIERGSLRFTPREQDFANPLFAPHFEIRTGGTRSSGTPVGISLQFIAELACNHAVGLKAHGLGQADHLLWHTAPLRDLLFHAKLGRPAVAWRYPVHPPQPVRLVAYYLAAMGRLIDRPFPLPAWQDPREPEPLLDWIAARESRGPLAVTSLAGSAVRLAAAASKRGQSLGGVAFIMRGEPFSEGRRATILQSGARAIDSYGFVESGGLVGLGCPWPNAVDDVHLFTDRLAVVQRQRTWLHEELAVDALLFTSLIRSAPWIQLNVENGDHGVVERRICGCTLSELGLRTHLRDTASHEKMTVQGQTFIRSRLIPVVEQELPARFGGGALDYQLVEEEQDGLSRLVLLVDPRLGPLDPADVKQALLAGLGGEGLMGSYMARVWKQLETVEVQRSAPLATASGKVYPLHRRSSQPTSLPTLAR